LRAGDLVGLCVGNRRHCDGDIEFFPYHTPIFRCPGLLFGLPRSVHFGNSHGTNHAGLDLFEVYVTVVDEDCPDDVPVAIRIEHTNKTPHKTGRASYNGILVVVSLH
jgi:hypothetical protein